MRCWACRVRNSNSEFDRYLRSSTLHVWCWHECFGQGLIITALSPQKKKKFSLLETQPNIIYVYIRQRKLFWDFSQYTFLMVFMNKKAKLKFIWKVLATDNNSVLILNPGWISFWLNSLDISYNVSYKHITLLPTIKTRISSEKQECSL